MIHPPSSSRGASATAAASSTDELGSGLRVGARVMVRGLGGGAELNSRFGKIERWDSVQPPSGRWIVRINGQQGTNALQAKNLGAL